MANQWAEGITQLLGFIGGSCMRNQLELKWKRYDRVGRVVYGVVIQFKSIK